MSSTGTTISRSSSFGLPASTIAQLAPRADEELGDPLQRPLGGRQPDPLQHDSAEILRFASASGSAGRPVALALCGGFGLRRDGRHLRIYRGFAASANEMLESFQSQREVGAALRLGDGVDLVDDHRLDAGRGSRAPARSSSGRATRAS